jgi:hypothetical protein
MMLNLGVAENLAKEEPVRVGTEDRKVRRSVAGWQQNLGVGASCENRR